MLVDAAHVILEFFAVSEGVVELLHQLFLLAAQFIRVGGVDCGEIVVANCRACRCSAYGFGVFRCE